MHDIVGIRYAVLVLLSEEPRKGQQLHEALAAEPGRTRPPPTAELDATLRRLEHDGLVESGDASADDRHQEFRITADGERELAGWLRTPAESQAICA